MNNNQFGTTVATGINHLKLSVRYTPRTVLPPPLSPVSEPIESCWLRGGVYEWWLCTMPTASNGALSRSGLLVFSRDVVALAARFGAIDSTLQRKKGNICHGFCISRDKLSALWICLEMVTTHQRQNLHTRQCGPFRHLAQTVFLPLGQRDAFVTKTVQTAQVQFISRRLTLGACRPARPLRAEPCGPGSV